MEQRTPSLEVEFANLKFQNPFILASAPPTRNASMVERAFEAGWAGAVIKTIPSDSLMQRGMSEEPRPLLELYRSGTRRVGMGNISIMGEWRIEDWAAALPALKARFPDRIVLASIGAEMIRDDWQSMAIQVTRAGFDGMELDLSCTHATLGKEVPLIVGEDPKLTRQLVGWVTEVSDLPIIPKLPATVRDWKAVLKACQEAGAAGTAAINSLSALMGVNLETMEPLLNVSGKSSYCGYSGPGIKPIALRVISQMHKHGNLPISGIGGISSWQDATEFLLLGAKTVQVCTAVMWEGYHIIGKMTAGLQKYMQKKGLASIDEIVGIANEHIVDSVFQLEPDYKLVSFVTEACTGCERCVTACADGAYQAIMMNQDNRAVVLDERCVGCALCIQVCPANAIVLRLTHS